MFTIELTSIARTYREMQAEIKALQEQADALKQRMISELNAQQADTLTAGEYTIRHTLYETTRLDAARIKAAGLFDQFSAKTAALRFSVA